jgi:hypothetical protein
MYIYDRKFSEGASQTTEPSGERAFLGSFAAAGTRQSSAANQSMPAWLEDGVRQGRWKPETAAGFWALRKLAKG